MNLYIFPSPLTTSCALGGDAGWMVLSHPGAHPSNGAPCQVFDLPADTPDQNGATLAIPGYPPLHGILYLHLASGAAFFPDVYPAGNLPVPSTGPVRIVDDHFERSERRWIVRGVDGFCDHALWLDGQIQQLRDGCKQTQDLGGNLRRVFGCMKNIRSFDPQVYGERFYTSLPELFAIYGEYDLFGEYDVLPDTGYWGKSLGWCQGHWARSCDVLGPIENRLVSLTNEYDHGGNLVGTVADYPRPEIELVSQGSAVSDAPPPRPGWGFREFHCSKPYPKGYLFEDQLFNREGVDADGTRWGPRKAIYLSEGVRFSETDPFTDERLARTTAYEALALGEGMVIHNDFGKYSQLMGPRVARCAKVILDILNAA